MPAARPIQVMPDMRMVHPDYGDITEDVARELAALNAQAHERVVAQAARRQLHIARTAPEARVIDRESGMRLVAQIDEGVFNYWEAREGREFWSHELDYMLKRHPELGVKTAGRPQVGYRGAVRGKRGRWAA